MSHDPSKMTALEVALYHLKEKEPPATYLEETQACALLSIAESLEKLVKLNTESQKEGREHRAWMKEEVCLARKEAMNESSPGTDWTNDPERKET